MKTVENLSNFHPEIQSAEINSYNDLATRLGFSKVSDDTSWLHEYRRGDVYLIFQNATRGSEVGISIGFIRRDEDGKYAKKINLCLDEEAAEIRSTLNVENGPTRMFLSKQLKKHGYTNLCELLSKMDKEGYFTEELRKLRLNPLAFSR